MKKLLKKLKKNQLLSKISACLMIVVILVSCLGVSTFAADETEAAKTGDSVLDVWTGVTDAIIDSLGSAQNLFFTRVASQGEGSFILPDRTFTVPPYLYTVSDFSYSLSEGDSLSFSIPDLGVSLTFEFSAQEFNNVEGFGGSVEHTISGQTFTYSAFYVPSNNALLFITDNPYNFSGLTVNYGVSVYDYQLSFLGVLAIFGVGISIVFLLIAVISRFLRLRG